MMGQRAGTTSALVLCVILAGTLPTETATTPAAQEAAGACGPPPETENGSHNGTGDTYSEKSIVAYNCDRGYNWNGFPYKICLRGKWVVPPGATFECKLKTCPSPGQIANGDREGFVFTVGARVKYTCHKGYKMIGRAVSICFFTGLWSMKKPSCVPITCPKLPPVRHLRVKANSREYLSVAKLSCDEGYALSGPEERVCQITEKWSGEENACTEIVCDTPRFDDGVVNLDTPAKYGDIAVFSCKGGKTLVGMKTAVCVRMGGWSQEIPVCVDTCDVPTIDNSVVMMRNPGPSYFRYVHVTVDSIPNGESLYVHCSPKYELTLPETHYGKREITCEGGKWPPLPKCKPEPCWQTPGELKNGHTMFDSLEHGARIYYNCNPGYTLVPYQRRTCDFGQWTGEKPSCVKNYCQPPSELPEGTEVKDDPKASRYAHDHTLTVRCQEGYFPYSITDTEQWTCYNTTWLKKEKLRCEKQPCEYEAGPFEEVIGGERRQDSRFSHKTTIKVKCTRHRSFTLTHDVAVCNAGKWEPGRPTCEAAPCKPQPEVADGQWVYPDDTVSFTGRVPHNTTVTIKCNNGYDEKPKRRKRRRRRELRCVYGKWVGPVPSCQPGRCRPFPGGEKIPHEDYLTVGCNEGYHVGKISKNGEYHRNMTSQCLLGKWKPFPPRCNPDACEFPPLRKVKLQCPDGPCELDADGRIAHDTNVSLSCVNQFYKWDNATGDNPPDKLSCWLGKWIPALNHGCVLDGRSCPDPGETENAARTDTRLTEEEPFVPGDTVVYDCAEGFLADGAQSQVIDCMENGTWSQAPANCSELVCKSPEEVENGQFIPVKEQYAYNETVMLVCDEETRRAEVNLTCSKDGQWSPPPPACTNISCPQLDWPKNGWAVGGQRQVGEKVTFHCNDGFSLQGSKSRVCQPNGVWDGISTECVAGKNFAEEYLPSSFEKSDENIDEVKADVEAGVVDTLSRGDADRGSHLYGEVKCKVTAARPNVGLAFMGWSDGKLNRLDVVAGDMVTEGTIVRAYCDRGTLVTGNRRECKQGRWTGREPRCEEASVDCTVSASQPHVRSVYRDADDLALSTTPGSRVAPGSLMLSRCEAFGNLKFTGQSKRTCEGGQWTGDDPKCSEIKLGQGNSAIRVFRFNRKPVTLSDEGHLLLPKGSTVALSCQLAHSRQFWEFNGSAKFPEHVREEPSRTQSFNSYGEPMRVYYNDLLIWNAGNNHRGTYSCVSSQTHTPTAEFVVRVV